jgi:hypothetical protein
MKLVDQNGLTYIVHFSYSSNIQYRQIPGNEARVTTCALHVAPCLNIPCDITAGLGSARCSPKDEFRKIIGRKMALARAMMAMNLPLLIRTQLWHSYLAQVAL